MAQEYLQLKQAAYNHVKTTLGGRSKKIVCLCYPEADVWAESCESGVNDPTTSDTPVYARVCHRTGKIKWTEYAEFLSEAQRKLIRVSAAKIRVMADAIV